MERRRPPGGARRWQRGTRHRSRPATPVGQTMAAAAQCSSRTPGMVRMKSCAFARSSSPRVSWSSSTANKLSSAHSRRTSVLSNSAPRLRRVRPPVHPDRVRVRSSRRWAASTRIRSHRTTRPSWRGHWRARASPPPVPPTLTWERVASTRPWLLSACTSTLRQRGGHPRRTSAPA